MKTSFMALLISGLMIMLSIIVFIINISAFGPAEIVGSILLLAIAISTHGLLHANEENTGGFNPIMGEYKPSR